MSRLKGGLTDFRLLIRWDPVLAAKRVLLYAIAFLIRFQARRSCRPCDDLPMVVWCDPDRITHSLSLPGTVFSTVRGEEPIIGCCDGAWDLFTEDMQEWALYAAFRERYLQGRDWEEIEYYQRMQSAIERGYVAEGCESISELDKRYRELDRLYDSIREHGYQRQTVETDFGGVSVPDELRVGIDRNGSLVRIGGGKHRLFAAQLLGVEQIPILVMIVHEQWDQLEANESVHEAMESIGLVRDPAR